MGTYFYDPIDKSPGRLAGNSRKWGDAPPEVKEKVKEIIVEKAKYYGLDERDTAYLLAIAHVESGFNPDAAAKTTSAAGIGQLIDSKWKKYGNGDRFDANANIDAMIKLYLDLKNKVEKYGLSDEYIYKLYHDGEGSIKPDGSIIPKYDHGGLDLSKEKVMPLVEKYYALLSQNESSFSSTTPHTHTVQPGDTLSKIVKRYNVSVEDLLRANPRIKNPDYIQVGWKIKIPGYAEKVRRNLREGTRRIDPLVIDLDGDGIELVDIKESTAMFDLSGSGFANRVGWVSSDDGFLVLDKNNDNRIKDISEMFGNATQSGFAMLSLYDTNRDGRIDAFDDVFKNLKVWQDRDGDGRTDERELKNLAELGIKAINLNTTHTNINQGGNQITEIGSVEKEDGTETQAGNVNFELDRLYSYYNREVILNPEIVGLPWVKGYGFMPDLPIAMSMDETLLQMVKDAVEETDLAKLKEKFEKIIFRWAGVENIREEELGISWAILSGNDRENRFLHFDGGITLSYEQVGAIIKFVGATPEEVRDGIRHRSGRFLLEAWNTMFQGLFTRFVVDAGLLEDILPAYYDFFTDRIILAEEFDTGAFRTQIKQMFLSDDPNQSVLATLSLLVLKEVNALDSVVDFYADENIFFKLLSSPYAQFIIPKLISGTQGNDWLYGTDGNDVIVGKEGDDNLYGLRYNFTQRRLWV